MIKSWMKLLFAAAWVFTLGIMSFKAVPWAFNLDILILSVCLSVVFVVWGVALIMYGVMILNGLYRVYVAPHIRKYSYGFINSIQSWLKKDGL